MFTSMGFNTEDRLALGKLMVTPEEALDDMTIEEWFAHTPHFFTTNFWYMWQTTLHSKNGQAYLNSNDIWNV